MDSIGHQKPNVDQVVVGLIPAKLTSRRLKRKNLADLGGIPLFVHSIRVSKKTDELIEVFVSTDYETIGLRYEDASKVGEIVRRVKDMLTNHPEIDTGQTMIVNFNKFAPSSLDFFVYTFTKTTNWIHFHEVKQDVLLKIVEIIEQQGAEIAFPTSTVHLADQEILKNLSS